MAKQIDKYRKQKDDYFQSLIAPPAVKKKRACLSCGREFISNGYGHRICCNCDDKVNSMGPRAEESYI